MKSNKDLVNHWKNFNSRNSIHNDDTLPETVQIQHFSSLKEYCNSSEYFNKSSLIHTGLAPMPYCGNIKNAKDYFLLLNPGFAPQDYFDEHVKKYKNTLKKNLKQSLSDFSFFPLNPDYCWTGSARWWHKKLNPLIREVMKIKDINYKKACRFLSDKVCSLELFPYHSKVFGINSSHLSNLKSTQLIQGFARELSKDENKLIIIMRAKKHWGLKYGPHDRNVIAFSSTEARGAQLTESYIRKILDRILI